MLVVDVEKFVSPEAGITLENSVLTRIMAGLNLIRYFFAISESWFSMDAKDPVGYALVEIVEGSDMKPSDMNGKVT